MAIAGLSRSVPRRCSRRRRARRRKAPVLASRWSPWTSSCEEGHDDRDGSRGRPEWLRSGIAGDLCRSLSGVRAAAASGWCRVHAAPAVVVDQPVPRRPRRVDAARCVLFAELVDRRLREPTDDVLGILAANGLPRAHLHSVAMLLLTGGNETTAHLLGNAFHVVASTPALHAKACGGELDCARIIEESLRRDSPVQMLMRHVMRDVEIGDKVVPAGARVGLLVGSANRDESVFADPDKFIPSRGGRPHLAFGLGPHLCVGAKLSRREAMIGLAEVCRGPAWDARRSRTLR